MIPESDLEGFFGKLHGMFSETAQTLEHNSVELIDLEQGRSKMEAGTPVDPRVAPTMSSRFLIRYKQWKVRYRFGPDRFVDIELIGGRHNFRNHKLHNDGDEAAVQIDRVDLNFKNAKGDTHRSNGPAMVAIRRYKGFWNSGGWLYNDYHLNDEYIYDHEERLIPFITVDAWKKQNGVTHTYPLSLEYLRDPVHKLSFYQELLTGVFKG